MKLIIEIPESDYKAICANKENAIIAHDTCRRIAHGIPLDDIKTEIKEWYWQVDKQALAKDPCVVDAMVDLFIRTIYKNTGKAESEDKE